MAVLLFVAYFAVFDRVFSTADLSASATSGHTSAGVAGLALSYALPIVGALQGLIGAFTETEKEFVAVERAREILMCCLRTRRLRLVRWP